jgi:hypothetical protein
MTTTRTGRAGRPIVWRTRTRPVAVHEVTAVMLAPVQRAADASWLPQTVWPSRYYGGDYVGEDCLLTSAAAVLDLAPSDAAPESAALLTVIPRSYYAGRSEQ